MAYLSLSYIHYKQKGSCKWYAGSLFAFFLALMSKPASVLLPFVLFLVDYKDGRKFNKAGLLEKIPYLLPAIAIASLTLQAHEHTIMTRIPYTDKILIAGKSFVFYLGKIMFPVRLAAIYPYPPDVRFLSKDFLLPWTILVFLIPLFLLFGRKSKAVLFGFLFFIVMIFPTLFRGHFDQFYAADRYAYVPLLGILYLVCHFALRLSNLREAPSLKRIRAVFSVGVLLCLLLSVVSYARTLAWQNSEILFTDTLEKYPRAHIAHNNLGILYQERGELDRAAEKFKDAIRFNPHSPIPHLNLGVVYRDQKKFRESILELEPFLPQAVRSIGITYFEAGMIPEAIFAFQKAIEMQPAYSTPYSDLAHIYRLLKQPEKAVEFAKKSLARNPLEVNAHYLLGGSYLDLGRFQEAETSLKRTLLFKADYAAVYAHLGILYAKEERFHEAIQAFETAVRLDPEDDESHQNLALLYLRTGHSERAREILGELPEKKDTGLST